MCWWFLLECILVVIFLDSALEACAGKEARRKVEHQSENSTLSLLFIFILLWAKEGVDENVLPDSGLFSNQDDEY